MDFKDLINAVRDFLITNDIDSCRFSVFWYGEDQPVADNATSEGRQKNRRVEMEIVE